MCCVVGFRPGRRGPFVPAKGPKTIDAPSGLIGADGRQAARRADQLPEPVLSFIEGLKQGPPAEESVPPMCQTAGVGNPGSGSGVTID